VGELIVLVPVLARPDRVAPLLEAFEETAPQARVVFIVDPDDVVEREMIDQHGAEELLHAGSYAEKINAGVRGSDEDLVLLGADDVVPHAGWLEAAIASLAPGLGVVGTNDLGNPRVIAGEHSTHPLLTRSYAELPCIDGCPGPLFEGYLHNFCDTELVATAKHRGAWAFAGEAIVEHLHPVWGKGERDATYERGELGFLEDARTFKERRSLWA
jgi:hypothetical protein